jgi:hypothetical protein
MASKNILNDSHIVELLFNECSEDNLIPESDYNERSDDERTESRKIAPIPEVIKFGGAEVCDWDNK